MQLARSAVSCSVRWLPARGSAMSLFDIGVLPRPKRQPWAVRGSCDVNEGSAAIAEDLSLAPLEEEDSVFIDVDADRFAVLAQVTQDFRVGDVPARGIRMWAHGDARQRAKFVGAFPEWVGKPRKPAATKRDRPGRVAGEDPASSEHRGDLAGSQGADIRTFEEQRFAAREEHGVRALQRLYELR